MQRTTRGWSSSPRHFCGSWTTPAPGPASTTSTSGTPEASRPTVIALPDWGRLSEATLALLRSPWFSNRTAPLQGGAANDPATPVSVLYGPAEEPWLRINTGRLEPDRFPAPRRDALLELKAHLDAAAVELPSEPGGVTIIDNRRVAHARPAFRERPPAYDGSDRWQRRVTACDDEVRVRAYEEFPHVVEPRRLLGGVGRPGR